LILQRIDKQVVAAISGYIFSGLFIVSLPIWVSAVIDDLAISERIGGYLGSFEIGCVAIAMLVVSRYTPVINKRKVALIGGLLSIAANIGSAIADTLIILSVMRMFVGLGLGSLLVCALSTAAATTKSQHTFAYMEASLAVAASIFYTLSALQLEMFGSSGVFITLALIQLACLPLLRLIPVEKFAVDIEPENANKVAKPRWSVICVNGLFYCGMFSFWTFVSRIGASLDISHMVVGNVLSVAFVAAVISTLSVPFLARYLGYRITVVWTVLVMAIAGFSLTHAFNLIVFAVAVIVLKFHFLLYSTMMNGMFAVSDATGRSNGYGLAFAIVGSAVGPALGGELLSYAGDGAGYGLLGWLTCLIWTLCLPVIFMLARHVDTGTRKISSVGVAANMILNTEEKI